MACLAGRLGGLTGRYHQGVAVRITPAQRLTSVGQHADMERSIAISSTLTGSAGLYSSVVTTEPGSRTRIHHHGPCETSIFILSGVARFTFGPTGIEDGFDATAGDFVYIPAGEVHVEANASATDQLVVVLTRNCPASHVVYLDGGGDGGAPPLRG